MAGDLRISSKDKFKQRKGRQFVFDFLSEFENQRMKRIRVAELTFRILKVRKLGLKKGVKLLEVLILTGILLEDMAADDFSEIGSIDPFNSEILKGLGHECAV